MTLELVAVQVDRVVVHRAQVAEADAHALARFDDQRRGAGERLAVEREHVEVGHLDRVRPARAGVDLPLVQHEREVAVDAAAARRLRGWTTNMPIMPSAICVISSKCGWYMNVPCWRSVNSYLKVSPGGIGFWVRPPTPSMPLGSEHAVPVDAWSARAAGW